MATSREKIDNVYKLNGELKSLLEKESDLYKKATDNRETKIEIKRDGKKITVSEGELWEEIRIAGANGEAAKLMKKKYPDVFKVALEREAKNTELHDYVQKSFGFSFRHMGIADYLKLTEAVIDAKLEEK